MRRPGTGPIWPDAGDRSRNSLHDLGVLLEKEVPKLNSVVENGVAAVPINGAAPTDANPTVDAMGYLVLLLKLFEYLHKDDRLYRAHKAVVVEGIQDSVSPKFFVGYTKLQI